MFEMDVCVLQPSIVSRAPLLYMAVNVMELSKVDCLSAEYVVAHRADVRLPQLWVVYEVTFRRAVRSLRRIGCVLDGCKLALIPNRGRAKSLDIHNGWA